MLELFRSEVKIGNLVKVFLVTGQEPQGIVKEIGKNYLLLLNNDGNNIRLFEKLIGGWEILQQLTISETDTSLLIEESDKVFIQPKPNEILNNFENQLEQQKKEIISEIPETEIKPAEPIGDTTKKGLTGLKIIGKIDLSKISYNKEKTEKNVKINSSKSVSEHIKQQKDSIIALQTAIDLEHEIIEIGKKTIPANATIKLIRQNKNYGFLTDRDGKDYFFSFTEILDEKLEHLLLNDTFPESLQVICNLKNDYGKLKATDILLPKQLFEHLKLAENYYLNRQYHQAIAIVDLITRNFPHYTIALDLKNKILSEKDPNVISPSDAQSAYIQAKFELKRGNHEEAKKLLLLSIENYNPKSESALKDLAQLLQREGKIDQAIELVKKQQGLIKTSDPNSLLAYFYETKKDYKTALEYLSLVNPSLPIDQLRLNKRLAIAYFKIKDFDSSELYLKRVLSKQPGEFLSQKLLEALAKVKAEGVSEEIESIFNEAELSSLTGGLSPFIQFVLENSEYHGVPSAEVANESFSKRTLIELKRLIDALKDGRPKERAELYLSEAKVQKVINSEDEKLIKASLAKFSTSFALSWSSDNRNIDTFRFYILEACSLNPEFGIISPYIPMYLHSFFMSSYETRTKSSQPLKSLIDEVFDKELNDKFWLGIIDLILVNKEFTTKFLTYIFNNPKRINICLRFLNKFLEKNIEAKKLLKNDFLELWNKASDKRKRDRENTNAKFLAIDKTKTSEEFMESFESIKSSINDLTNNLDKHRINLIEDITNTLFEFNNQDSFEDKERYYNIATNQILSLQNEIEESPTELTFSIIRKLLSSLIKLLDKEFRLVIDTSKPEVSLRILGEGVIHENNIVIAQVNVSNKKGSAPISSFSVIISDSDGVELLDGKYENNQSLKGGEDKTLKIKIRVDNVYKEQGALNLNLLLTYKVRGSEDELHHPDNLTLRLYSEEEFELISNPFAATADSGPVQDEKMFFGRDEFIDNIKNSVLESSSKCVIIYGQKRSGKSSVLYHLKQRLNISNKAFCISFSLGEIVDDLSSLTFYYKILTEIEDTLDVNGFGDIIKYKAPKLSELKEAPSIMFYESIRNFKRLCSEVPEWKNRNLIILLDEFTYIYTAIQKEFLSEQFMKTWKSFVEKGFFTSILIGQDIMPKFKLAYQNEFGIAEDRRLSYLSREDAIKLIEQPIWDDKRNRSRYLGKALDLVLDYTSSNPYYIQIFCSRVVEYMNFNKAISVTEADIFDVVQILVKGEQAFTADKFDNLITAGDADTEAFDPKDVLKALQEIAFASKNLDSCSRDTIKLGNHEYEEEILNDLRNREVISCPQPGLFKIKVRLFKEWLLNN